MARLKEQGAVTESPQTTQGLKNSFMLMAVAVVWMHRAAPGQDGGSPGRGKPSLHSRELPAKGFMVQCLFFAG